MENKSEGGACIRIGIPIIVGSKLGIRCRWEQFSGTARYCIVDEGAYLVGIQRDKMGGAVIGQLVPTAVPQQVAMKSADPPVSAAKPQSLQQPQETKRPGIAAPIERKVEKAPVVRAAERTVAIPPRGTTSKIESRAVPPERRPERPPERRQDSPRELDRPRRIEPQTTRLPEEKAEETGKKRKHMRRNWFGMAQNAKDVPGGNEIGKETANGANGNRLPKAAPPAEKISADPPGEDAAGFPIELMSVEDIYSTSGIRAPKKDYGISKVIEMLRSEHVRGLPNEMKRAAVLMALDAARIPIEEVLRDAKARQDALDSYETERRKQIEAEWARKAKENAEILAELESAKLHHMACINRNLDRIVREKATFDDWLAIKQQESQNILEAAALCLKSSAPAPAANALSGASAAGAAGEPAPVPSLAQSPEKTPR
jgi:hypothetical protein